MNSAKAILLADHFADRSLIRFAAAAGKALRSWWYWQSRQGAQRIRERRAIDAVVGMLDPFWREHDRERLQRSIDRPAWWWGASLPPRMED